MSAGVIDDQHANARGHDRQRAWSEESLDGAELRPEVTAPACLLRGRAGASAPGAAGHLA